jgi:hypothetical protein
MTRLAIGLLFLSALTERSRQEVDPWIPSHPPRRRVRIVLAPVQAPNANAYAERFVRSIREECLDRLIFFGERRLLRALDAFVAHYHRERNHQGLGNELIIREPRPLWATQCVAVSGWADCYATTTARLEHGRSFRTSLSALAVSSPRVCRGEGSSRSRPV